VYIPLPIKMVSKYVGGSVQSLSNPYFFVELREAKEFISAIHKPTTPDVLYILYHLEYAWNSLVTQHIGSNHVQILRDLNSLIKVGIIEKKDAKKVPLESHFRAHEKKNGFTRKTISYVYTIKEDWLSLIGQYLNDPSVIGSIQCKNSVDRELEKIQRVRDLYEKQRRDAPLNEYRRLHNMGWGRMTREEQSRYLELHKKYGGKK